MPRAPREREHAPPPQRTFIFSSAAAKLRAACAADRLTSSRLEMSLCLIRPCSASVALPCTWGLEATDSAVMIMSISCSVKSLAMSCGGASINVSRGPTTRRALPPPQDRRPYLVALNHVAGNVEATELEIVVAAHQQLFENGVALALLLDPLAGVRMPGHQRKAATGRLAQRCGGKMVKVKEKKWKDAKKQRRSGRRGRASGRRAWQ